MPERIDRLNAALAGHYVLERELGQGGMATVYLARDVKQHRAVAIKVLRPELATALGPERFLREIEIAANLTHPHILPLFNSGDADGFLYYVMPFVAGESLRDRIKREKQLPVDDALQLTREIAEALGAAHSRGIVHRDIKPENVLLQGGHAVVSDFGIARAISAADEGDLTATGIAIGTPAYMSPEQAAGERDVDGRSDLYSLACVTYEMLLGHPPFSGISAHELLARHTSDPVPPLRTVRGTVPEAVEDAVAHALAKMPADRYATAAQFVAALSAASPSRRPGRPRRRVALPWVIGIPAGIAATVLAVLFGPHLPHPAPAAEQAPHVVVLPPQHLDSSAEQWFANGVTSEISRRLTQISGLGVIASQTAAQFASSGKTLRKFGDEIHAQYALALSIEYDQAPSGPRRVKVSAQLIRVSNGQELWGERYIDTLTSGQLFDTEARVAEHVAEALNVTLLTGERRELRTRPTDNPDAYDAYLRGNQYSHGASLEVPATPTERLAGIAEYRRAVGLDPDFAEAHAMLAIQLARIAATDSALAPARAEADRALELRPDLAWAHFASAACAFEAGDWDRFRTDAAVADQLNQNSAELLQATASYYDRASDFEKMAHNYERAAALNPLSWETALALGVAYFSLHRHTEAEHQFDRAIALDSTQAGPYMYKTWLQLSWHGSVEDASAVLQEAVRRFGIDKGFASGFLNSDWWASRLLAEDSWYRTTLEQVSLSRHGVDSSSYFEHKAGLYQALGQNSRARAYWDSLADVAKGQLLQPGLLPGVESLYRDKLAQALAATGNRQRAIEEEQRSAHLYPSDWINAFSFGLVYAQLGDADSAAAYFERSLVYPGWVTPAFLSLDPTFDRLKSNPRFRRLLEPNARH